MGRTRPPVVAYPDCHETPDVRVGVALARAANDTALLSVTSDLDYCTSSPVRDAIEIAPDAGAEKLVIGLSGVTFLDASGIGVTVLAARSLGLERTSVVCPDRWLRSLFRLTGLDGVLTICRSREERGGRPPASHEPRLRAHHQPVRSMPAVESGWWTPGLGGKRWPEERLRAPQQLAGGDPAVYVGSRARLPRRPGCRHLVANRATSPSARFEGLVIPVTSVYEGGVSTAASGPCRPPPNKRVGRQDDDQRRQPERSPRRRKEEGRR